MNAFMGLHEYQSFPTIKLLMLYVYMSDMIVFIDKIVITATWVTSLSVLIYWFISKTIRPGWRQYLLAFLPMLLLAIREIIKGTL